MKEGNAGECMCMFLQFGSFHVLHVQLISRVTAGFFFFYLTSFLFDFFILLLMQSNMMAISKVDCYAKLEVVHVLPSDFLSPIA